MSSAEEEKPVPVDQIVVQVHRVPGSCYIDLIAPANSGFSRTNNWKTLSTPDNANLVQKLPFTWEIIQPEDPRDKRTDEEKAKDPPVLAEFTLSGEYLPGERECRVNLETTIDGARKFASVKSFTPLLGVGRETTLAPGNMATFVLTKSGDLVSRISASNRSDVLATKYEEEPEPEDTWEEEAKEFLAYKRPQKSWWEQNKNKVLIISLVLLAVAGVAFIVRRRK